MLRSSVCCSLMPPLSPAPAPPPAGLLIHSSEEGGDGATGVADAGRDADPLEGGAGARPGRAVPRRPPPAQSRAASGAPPPPPARRPPHGWGGPPPAPPLQRRL